MLIALDYVTLAVRDLELAVNRYAALFGREQDWRGSVDGAEQAIFQLDNTSLVLLARTGEGSEGERVQDRIEQQGEGIWAMTFATDDMSKARHIIQRRGIESTEPKLIEALAIDGNERRCWKLAELDSAATHGVSICLSERSADDFRQRVRPREMTATVTSLDHIVVTTSQPDRATALYGARLGLDMKLDRTNPAWGARLIFFKCDDLVVEIAHNLRNTGAVTKDRLWGLSWRAVDLKSAHARIAQSGHTVSEIREGRKPGTQVFTVRDAAGDVPTLVIGRA